MAWLRNKSERAFNIGGNLIAPLANVELPDHFLNNARVKEIIANGELEVSEETKAVVTETSSDVAKPADTLPPRP